MSVPITMKMEILANPGKNLLIEVDHEKYIRYPVKTHVIGSNDNIRDVCLQYVSDKLYEGDILFISERIVAITQGRAFPISEINPGWLAKKLSQYVHRSKHGIGLGSAWTMELAIREAGIFRILFAAALSAVTKIFGIKGIFYHVVGSNINAIDGPCDNTLPPYNTYAKLGPANPNKVAKDLKRELGVEVVIIDANDLGVNVLGRSSEAINKNSCRLLFKDNPLGQSLQQTPLCIVRKAPPSLTLKYPFRYLFQSVLQQR
jgi:F420-0:gamma-glutamyl ligase-like protein